MDTVAILKYSLLLLSSPIWLPFVKELLREFRLAMRADGGFWGQSLSPREQQALREQIAREPLRQVHLPKGHLGIKRHNPAQDPTRTQMHAGPQTGARASTGFGRK